jgi:hypothetical protein
VQEHQVEPDIFGRSISTFPPKPLSFNVLATHYLQVKRRFSRRHSYSRLPSKEYFKKRE